MIHMRKKWLLGCLAAVILVLLCGSALGESCMVTATKLMLRSEANSESLPLQTLPQGTTLEIIQKEGHWYKVSYGKFTGYVYDLYVTLDARFEEDGILQKGERGTAVQKVQERLKELGYYKATCDGNFGTVTENAVRAFQKNNGLVVDGLVGASTTKKLNSASAIRADGKPANSTQKEEPAAGGTLSKGAKGDAVKKLQERLKELGYYKNTCDGSYGDKTVVAVKAFQKKNGLPQDGVAGQATLKKLNASSAIGANDKTETEKPDTTTLRQGSKGAAVKALQQRLKELGYYTYACDSEYGARTVEAVKAFQKRNGLTQDGVAGEATLKKLNSTSAVPAKDAPATQPPKEDAGLRRGAKGDEVKKLQERLKELGYYDSTVDGSYGDRTVTAVKAFQKMNGLTQDGVAGEATLKKLNSTSAVPSNGSAGAALITSQTLQRGDSGVQVKALQKRLKELGFYTTAIDGDYGLRTATAVSDFQRANGLTVNGVANSTTLKKMVAINAVTKAEADAKEEAKKLKTENLDWFKNGKSTFAGRPTIQVKDVRTGLVFKAKVLYGTNHLDVEPLTKADTAILLKINGGVDFSWHRRPMLVKHNGHVYAASIYSEPHGDQTILDNNFPGQFCLHFLGSKTHGTEEVKVDHQACVAEAMKATW